MQLPMSNRQWKCRLLALICAAALLPTPLQVHAADAPWSPATNFRPTPAPPVVFDSVTLTADSQSPGTPLVHCWSNCVGAGRANEGLRASWLEALKTAHDNCGFQYVRFHGLFHTDMFVLRKGVENWQYVDDLFDRLLATGVRPFVELGFNPVDSKAKSTPWPTSRPASMTQFWWQGNTTPPADLKAWGSFVEDFTRHCVSRYEAEEVRQWYFECWNEPNLNPFFHGGTQAQYFALYQATAQAVKRVDPQLRVGGPTTSNFEVRLPDPHAKAARATHPGTTQPDDAEALDWQPVWVADFISFCADNKIPLDFISTHPYPQNFAIDDGGVPVSVRRSIDATHDDLTLLRKMVNASPFPNAQIELTEWNSSPSARDFTHDMLCPAAFIAKTNLDSVGLVDALSYWTFTDVFEEGGAGDTIFHGGFGLINYQGIVKPSFHAYRMLNALGDEVLSRGPAGIITRQKSTGKITALAYLYPPEVRTSLPRCSKLEDAQKVDALGHSLPLSLTLTNLPAGAAFEIETLDKDHGCALPAYQKMGMPNPPTREQTAQLKQAAWATLKETVHADNAGRLLIQRALDPWSLVLIKQQ